jgi:RNA polymerase sigma factor (sigma-70 family)
MSDGEPDSVERALRQLGESPADAAAWAVLFHRTWPYVLGLSHSFLGRSARLATAEDVAQEVFLLLARALHEGRLRRPSDEAGLRGLLLVMTRNHAVDSLRREHRRRRDVGRQVALPDEGPAAPPAGSPEAPLEGRELLDHLLAHLPPFDREVVLLLLSGHTPAAAARRLGTSLKTIRRRQQHIRSLLKTTGNVML